MILHHVAQRAAGLVVTRAGLDPEGFRRRDFDVVDVAAVPDRLEDGVGEAQHHDVLGRLLAEKMVDAIRVRLVEGAADDAVEVPRPGEVGAKGFFDDRARPAAFRAGVVEAAFLEPGDDRLELLRPSRKIEHAPSAEVVFLVEFVDAFGEGFVAVVVVELAAVIEKVLGEMVPEFLLDGLAGEFLGGLLHFLAEHVVGFVAPGETDDGHAGGQVAVGGEVVKGGDELAVGEVAGRAEDHQRTGFGLRTVGQPFTQWVARGLHKEQWSKSSG